MDWVKGFQKSINYIEEHITENLDYESIASEMNISEFYFQKIFSILCGFSLGEYIRNRRLTLAGNEILNTDEKIIDIALKYCYDTPEGFTRAFTRFHGITPNTARKNHNIPLKSFARLSISISLKGGNLMDYRIEKKEAFKMIVKTQRFTKLENVIGRKDIPAFWEECTNDGTEKYLLEIAKKDGVLGNCIAGLCIDENTTINKDFPYSIGVEYDGGEVPEGFKIIDIPALTWIIFNSSEHTAKSVEEGIQKLWHTVFAEFFPSSDYKPAKDIDLEIYSTDSYHNEIWISVENK